MGHYFGGHNFDWSEFNVGNYVRERNSFETQRFNFNLHTCEARSYGWWVFVLRVGNTIYFNDASYSMQTSQHQRLAENILKGELPELHGMKVKYLYIREGLNHLDTAIKNREHEIVQLTEAIKNPRSWKSTNADRKERIRDLKKDIQLYKKLAPKFEAQFEINSELETYFDDINTLKDRRKSLEMRMREQYRTKNEKPLVLKDGSFVAVRTNDRFIKKPSMLTHDQTLHVMTVSEFRAMEFLDAFVEKDIVEVIPVTGKSREDAVANLKQQTTVEFVVARMNGNSTPTKVVVK